MTPFDPDPADQGLAPVVAAAQVVDHAQVVTQAAHVLTATTVQRAAWRPLRWTEWLELAWRTMLIALLIWLIGVLVQLERLRARGVAESLAQHQGLDQRGAEHTRLLRAICLSTVTVYDANRGVCDPEGTDEVKKPPLPKFKGGPYPKPKPSPAAKP